MLGQGGITAVLGAATSLTVVLPWAQYSAQNFLFGAEFTRVKSHRHGSRRLQPGAKPQRGDADAI